MNRDDLERSSGDAGGRRDLLLDALKECHGITHVAAAEAREFDERNDRAPGSGADSVAALLRRTPR